jgi:phage regulator Rha-like protein
MGKEDLVPQEIIESKIFLIRGKKVMLDRDLASLYGVETKALKQTVKRNPKRFPDDFMFELNQEEFKNWRSQFVTSKADKMGLRYPPFAFTENGVAMLSSVLNSERAIQVNIQIMRTFTRLREILGTHVELRRKIEQLEKKYDGQFKIVFDALRALVASPVKPKRKIGFDLKEKQARYGRKKNF